jgi:hypothetical protein
MSDINPDKDYSSPPACRAEPGEPHGRRGGRTRCRYDRETARIIQSCVGLQHVWGTMASAFVLKMHHIALPDAVRVLSEPGRQRMADRRYLEPDDWRTRVAPHIAWLLQISQAEELGDALGVFWDD